MKNYQIYVSVLIPTYNEENYIENTIDTLLSNNYPKSLFEIIVIDGGSTDSTISIVNNKIGNNNNIKIYQNSNKIQSTGLNIGIKKSKGDIIIRADAHALYDKNYISESVKLLSDNDYQNVGPFQKSFGENIVSNAIAMGMNTIFGMGNAKYRLSENYLENVKSVWLGAWWKKSLLKLDGFDETLKISEDFDLNHRLRKIGGEIIASNKIKATYIVRKSLIKLFSQFFKYGFWKAKFLTDNPSEMQLRWVAPPLLVIYFFSIGVLSFISLDFLSLFFIYSTFIICGVIFNFRLTSLYNIISSLILFVVFPIIHFSWGLGFISGYMYWNILNLIKKTNMNT
jgi:glycosyltransferase involved in cell wall biosynthesis